jgi:alpha-tubulin suppressor-like RCC1 family protein
MGAVKTDGTLWMWGTNGIGQLGDGSTISRSSPGTTAGAGTNWCQVSIGATSTGAIKTDGTLWTWGANSNGRLGDGTTISRSSPGTTAGAGTNWCQASMGYGFTAALKTDGTLWTWGLNTCGSLGDGTTIGRSSPGTTAGGGTDWCQAQAGNRSTAAIKTDGTLWTWGCNSSGQLGTGNTTDRCSPVTTSGGGTNWCQVSAGFQNMAAVKTDGTLWSWGCNECGVLGDGTTINRASPVRIADSSVTTRPWTQVSVNCRHAAALAGIRVGIENSTLV